MAKKGTCSKQRYISDTAQQRNILHLDFIGATVLPSAIADRGWLVDTAKDMAHAMQLALSHRFSVGVAAFDSHCDSQLSLLLDVIEAANTMEWIALVPRDWRDNNKIGQLIRSSFYDFHTLPVDVDRLEITLGRAFGMAALRRTEFHAEHHQKQEMVGASPEAQAVLRAIWKVALVDAPVLITGETGTGKERAARIIHARSSRASAPFVAVNCAALPKELIQTELFGHERGAFTGAYHRNIGKIEAAAGGTLFLDE
ncbi:MAG TPA: sigma 54-interacting transcriptional regulator, partial [Pyrinomonadaceae bacterium]|nr:sigma 54-interacting transcriptional regulator [Pyrinomonadaceae bacterium]